MQMIRAYSGDEEATRLWKKYDSLSWAKLSEIYLSYDSLVGKDREVMLQVYIARRRKQQQDEKAKKTAAKEKRKGLCESFKPHGHSWDNCCCHPL